MKITMFGVSSSGKTCYLCAMAHLLQSGVQQEDFMLRLGAKRNFDDGTDYGKKLKEDYEESFYKGLWPDSTNKNTEYVFGVEMVCPSKEINDQNELVHELRLFDYAGGVWTDSGQEKKIDRDELVRQFEDSSVVLFLVDGNTLLKAMDPQKRNPCHRLMATEQEHYEAKQDIIFVRDLFAYYKQKRNGQGIPSVLVVVTKEDVFADENEFAQGKALVKELLPSIFAKGSQVEAAITNVSLGTSLGTQPGKDDKGKSVSFITGDLRISTKYNLHIPIVYAMCAYFSERYDSSPENEQNDIDKIYPYFLNMIRGRVEMFSNGYPLIAL